MFTISFTVAAAMINCPVGWLSTPPALRMFSAMPVDMVAMVAPTAKPSKTPLPNAVMARNQAMAMGSSEPTRPTTIDRRPTICSISTSTCRPASIMSSMRPRSPNISRASCLGARLTTCGPKTMPTTISPKRAGMPNRAKILPEDHSITMNMSVIYSVLKLSVLLCTSMPPGAPAVVLLTLASTRPSGTAAASTSQGAMAAGVGTPRAAT
mmetsp:Transcript_39050/g.121729  ORF Transcript_39050/g.121729 Transcript_39050/m.121729 type:complete len:210 (-) Transcript_39050:70-699(-)